MNKPGHDKPPELKRDDGKNRVDRETSMRAARLRAESEPPFWPRQDSSSPRIKRRAWIRKFEAEQIERRQYCKLAWAVNEMARRLTPNGETLLDIDPQRLKRALRDFQRAIGENFFGNQLLNICETERRRRLREDEARAIGSMDPAHFNGWSRSSSGAPGSRPIVEDLWTTRERLEALFVNNGWRVPNWLAAPLREQPSLLTRTGFAGQPSMEDAIGSELKRWIAGGRKLLLELKKFGSPEEAHRINKGTVCSALRAWALRNCRDDEKERVPTARTIENKHRALLDEALKVIHS